jgi:cell fate regulator YaaT (PSP1 superfamily)
MSQSNIIGVQFEEVGKNYYFDATRFPDIQPGEMVIVRTSRGLQLAKVTQVRLEENDLDLNSFKPIERPANPKDLLKRKALMLKEEEIKEKIREHLNENHLSAVKVVSAEYSLDGKRLFILINSENSVHFNIKRLYNDIQNMVKHVRLDLRQIGPRDAAKSFEGMGACGMEKRCCAKFLTEFTSISIRMAKTQDISLTPSEITGMCGRLRCCLLYEYDQYVDAIKTLPKRKRRVMTPMGEGRVVQILPLRQSVIVDIPEIGPRQFTKEELDRAEKIARGEEVEKVPPEKPKEIKMSRPEDQSVSRRVHQKSSSSKKRSSGKPRSRRERRSKKSRRKNSPKKKDKS